MKHSTEKRAYLEVNALRERKTVALARTLVGKYLVRRRADGVEESRMILETEAYHGEGDRACHARVGRTRRTAVMYAAGGCWYVYLCYGLHHLLNLVVGPEDFPAAILIRSVEGAVGPGRVTKALSVDLAFNAQWALEPTSGLWIEDRGVKIPRRAVEALPRVGVDYAGPVWAAKPWRFRLRPGELSGPRLVS
jgi:DNA-3-methyladenine glycosylase